MEILQSPAACFGCKDGVDEPFPFSMAFQPIVDCVSGGVYAYEALVRGPEGQPAAFVLNQVNDQNRYAFDQSCRVKAITLASRLGLAATGAMLSINFMPGAVYSPAACIQVTLKAARSLSFPLDRLIFEIVEAEKVRSSEHLMAIVDEYRNCGFKVALDDFGAGWSGVNLLASVSANILKLDMALTRNIARRPRAAAIVEAMVKLCAAMDIDLIAEGIETIEEYGILHNAGVRLMQGYLLAKPAFEQLPLINIPILNSAVA
jgi:EAL domain-containing protein (putative c-di-GMP-specific phosphodiesterase class I)